MTMVIFVSSVAPTLLHHCIWPSRDKLQAVFPKQLNFSSVSPGASGMVPVHDAARPVVFVGHGLGRAHRGDPRGGVVSGMQVIVGGHAWQRDRAALCRIM
jgi:hypothetical protein